MDAHRSPLTEARAFRAQERDGLTQGQIAAGAGVARPYVNKRLALLELDKEAGAVCEQAGLGFAHLYALCGLQGAAAQRRLARLAVKHGWSVRQTERAVGLERAGLRPAPRTWPGAHPDALALAQILAEEISRAARLPVDVRVVRGNRFEFRYVADTSTQAIAAARQLGVSLPDI